MTTDPYDGGSRYASLQDYLRVLRRFGLLIALIAVIGAGGGYANAKRQTPVYNATAVVAFQDPTQNLSVVGLATSSAQTPGQLAAIAADTLTRPALMNAVKRKLRTPLSAGALSGAVGATVSSNSGLLAITTAGSSGPFAAQFANTVAKELVAQDNHSTQLHFAAIAADVRKRITSLSGRRFVPGRNSIQLSVYQDELARLQTLSAFAKSAEVAEPAQPASTPASPKVLRSGVIGLILGLLLGVAAAFVRDSVDRRLRNAEDMHASYHLPVVGRVRRQVMGKIAHIAGSKDLSRDREAFRILRRNLEFLDPERPPHVVLVTSAVPEEGKTTVAGSLAFALASTGKRTLLVDCDLRRGTLSERLGLERSPGIVEYLAGEASPQDILRFVEFSEPDSVDRSEPTTNGHASPSHNLVFIPSGGSTSRAAELLATSRFAEFVEQVSATYDVIVFDSSPLLPVSDTLEMLTQVDSILLCARTSRTTREQAAAASAVLATYPERPTGLVITDVTASEDDYAAYGYSYASN